MEITKENIEQAISALRKCAEEHKKDVTPTFGISVSSICNDVADYLEATSRNVFKISEKRPSNGQFCWVLSKNRGYASLQCYNEVYNCWDDSEGDDYDMEINEDDVWMALPTGKEMESYANI